MQKKSKNIILVFSVVFIILLGIILPIRIIQEGVVNGGTPGCPYYTTLPSTPTLSQPTTPDTDGVIYLDWSDSARICHYNIYRKHQSEASYTKIASGIGGYGSSTPSSYTDTVSDNGWYWYYIDAYNHAGHVQSDYKSVKVEIPVPRPQSPTLNEILPLGDNTNGVVEFNWWDVSGATSYNVYRRTWGTSFKILKSGVTGSGLVGYTDSGLSSDTYYYVVTAVNSGGESDYSNEQGKTVSIPNIKPTASIDSIDPIYATQGEDIISFSGSGTDSDGTISAYQWLLADETVLSNSDSFEKSADEFSVGDIIIYFRVKDDRGDWSDKVSRMITIEEEEVILKPNAPHLGMINSPDDDGIIKLTWSVVYEADTYNVYRDGISIKTGLTINSYTDSDLSDGTYTYKITAVNVGGESDYSNEVIVVVEISNGNGNGDIPNAPVQYYLPDYDYDGNINLQWFVVSDADSYNIYRSSDGINFNKIASGITGNTYTDSCGDIGTYYYKITAVNTNGESDFSDVESTEVIEVEQEDLTGVIILLIIVIAIGITSIYFARKLRKKVR